MLDSLVVRTCASRRVSAQSMGAGQTRDSLVSIGDLLAVHARREEQDEGGHRDEEHCHVAIMHKRILSSVWVSVASGTNWCEPQSGTYDRGEDKDVVGEVCNDAHEREKEACGR